MDGELVPPDVSKSDLRDESHRRMHKAGYTDRDGQQMVRREIVSRTSASYRANYGRVFGHE